VGQGDVGDAREPESHQSACGAGGDSEGARGYEGGEEDVWCQGWVEDGVGDREDVCGKLEKKKTLFCVC
jgi:hypothetical protein